MNSLTVSPRPGPYQLEGLRIGSNTTDWGHRSGGYSQDTNPLAEWKGISHSCVSRQPGSFVCVPVLLCGKRVQRNLDATFFWTATLVGMTRWVYPPGQRRGPPVG